MRQYKKPNIVRLKLNFLPLCINSKNRTLGLELPANPAFNVEVPLSITTGWLRSRELPASPSAVAPFEAMKFKLEASYTEKGKIKQVLPARDSCFDKVWLVSG
jgi:hypothetical protein